MDRRPFTLPLGVLESDATRNAIAQAQTEKQFTARRLANLELESRRQANVMQLVILENAALRADVDAMRENLNHLMANSV